jgi:DtxR family manganese transport transcriptional regulator
MASQASNKTRPGPASQRMGRQAANLSHTRREHALETAEDYVEAIADLITEHGEARLVDLARRLGVSHATVNRTLIRLVRDGHVTTLPYRAIFLTEDGRKLAVACKRRHETVVAFLRAIGVSEGIAERDAEGIEHHVSDETLGRFKAFLRRA